MLRALSLVIVLAAAIGGASADEYWITYEGNDFPENEGWRRTIFEGGADRYLDQGDLVIDSRASLMIVDFYAMRCPGELDPDPGELFVMEWRMRIDEVTGFRDPTIGVSSDDKWTVGFEMNADNIKSLFEPNVSASFDPGVYHEFAFSSADMRTYQLRIDGEVAIDGRFTLLFDSSRVVWGDGIQGGASLSRWDYFRFGVVPEAATGDLNCDGAFNGADIDPFFLALGDPGEYERRFPDCDILNGDLNGDGAINGADIDPFFECLGSGGCP